MLLQTAVREPEWWLGVKPEAWITILAIVSGPIIALWLQRISERRREQRTRKRIVFKELMATRATRVSQRHVEALNAIDVEFYGPNKQDKKVITVWRLYHDHLSDSFAAGNNPANWVDKGKDLFVDLLYEMARAVGYEFDKVGLKRDFYTPTAQGQLEDELAAFRKGLVAFFNGDKALPVFMAGPVQFVPVKEEGTQDS